MIGGAMLLGAVLVLILVAVCFELDSRRIKRTHVSQNQRLRRMELEAQGRQHWAEWTPQIPEEFRR